MVFILRLINYAAFYLIWGLCLYLKGRDGALVTILAMSIYFALHLAFVSNNPKKELLFIFCLTCFGVVNESMLALTGVLSYADALYAGASWLTIVLWFCFSSTYWHAFSWLEDRPALAVILGAIVAPACYSVLAKAGVVTFLLDSSITMFFIGLDWAIILPSTFVFSRWFRTGFWTKIRHF